MDNDMHSQLALENKILHISGTVRMEQVSTLLPDCLSVITQVSAINLSQITNLDSSLLALLIECKKVNHDLQFSCIPLQLQTLIDVYHLQQIIS